MAGSPSMLTDSASYLTGAERDVLKAVLEAQHPDFPENPVLTADDLAIIDAVNALPQDKGFITEADEQAAISDAMSNIAAMLDERERPVKRVTAADEDAAISDAMLNIGALLAGQAPLDRQESDPELYDPASLSDEQKKVIADKLNAVAEKVLAETRPFQVIYRDAYGVEYRFTTTMTQVKRAMQVEMNQKNRALTAMDRLVDATLAQVRVQVLLQMPGKSLALSLTSDVLKCFEQALSRSTSPESTEYGSSRELSPALARSALVLRPSGGSPLQLTDDVPCSP